MRLFFPHHLAVGLYMQNYLVHGWYGRMVGTTASRWFAHESERGIILKLKFVPCDPALDANPVVSRAMYLRS